MKMQMTQEIFTTEDKVENEKKYILSTPITSWHSTTMKNFKTKTDDELEYIISDCEAAIEAGKNFNPKCGQYADEIHYANMELKKRQQQKAKEKTNELSETVFGWYKEEKEKLGFKMSFEKWKELEIKKMYEKSGEFVFEEYVK